MPPSEPVNGTQRIRPGRRESLRQVIDLQEAVHKVAMLLEKDAIASLTPTARARASLALGALGQSWVRLQDAKRVILGRPLPGSLRPESDPAKLERQLRHARQRTVRPLEPRFIEATAEQIAAMREAAALREAADEEMAALREADETPDD